MSNTMRWRYGETNPVVLAVAAETVIEIGDLVWVDSGAAKPAGDLADQLTEAANQEAFHDAFAGVALQQSRAGDTDPIRVATTGVFEFACPSGTFQVGALIGVDEASSGTELENQVAVGVATPNLAIGRCAKRVPTADTRLLVDIVSTILYGGPQAAA
ncbi:MAG: hypothetical protein K8T91_17820 [Planctomycetes bacterium]|nr:hypothetical protein [Planctomycetota bacterium]